MSKIKIRNQQQQQPQIAPLSALQYEVLTGLLLAEARYIETMVEHSLPQADASDEDPQFDEVAAEALYQIEERTRGLVQFLADFRSRVNHRPKITAEQIEDEGEEVGVAPAPVAVKPEGTKQ